GVIARRADDRQARRAKIDAGGTIVGEEGLDALARGGRDRHDIAEVETGRIARLGINVEAHIVLPVARGRDEDVSLSAGSVDRIIEGLRVTETTPAIVRDLRPMTDGIVQGIHGSAKVADA